MDLKEIKPQLTLAIWKQFKIPAPFVAWCHQCECGFMSIDEIAEHHRKNLNEHRKKAQDGTNSQ